MELQGKNKMLFALMSSISTFKKQVLVLIRDLNARNFDRFPNMMDHIQKFPEENVHVQKYVQEIQIVLDEFDKRFCDFLQLEELVEFYVNPMKDSNTDILANKLSSTFHVDRIAVEDEVLRLRSDVQLKVMLNERKFWILTCKEKYPTIRQSMHMLHSLFRSTYLCESAFSYMKIAKNKNRSRLTDQHMEHCLRVSLSSYLPDYDKLVGDIQNQTSH